MKIVLLFLILLGGCKYKPRFISQRTIPSDQVIYSKDSGSSSKGRSGGSSKGRSSSSSSSSSSSTESQLEDSSYIYEAETDVCHSDSDCILVKLDCCGCSQGGADKAIHRSKQASHQKEWDWECSEHFDCPFINRCGNLKPKCQNSACVMAE